MFRLGNQDNFIFLSPEYSTYHGQGAWESAVNEIIGLLNGKLANP